MRTKTLVAAVTVLLLAIALAACGSGGGGGGTAATLASLAVTPANSSIATGNTRQFTATGTYTDGSTQDITNSVTWTSSDTTLGTISATGLATAASDATGSATIRATSGDISGSTLLNVKVNLAQTGQTVCYDAAGAVVACANTGQDGDKLVGVAWPITRFTVTYCNAVVSCTDQSADCDGIASTDVVTDNLTGLMWTRDGHLPARTKVWADALAYANDLTLCGHTDWRLPNRKELRSLTNYGQPSTATWLSTQGFGNVWASFYWSSTTHAADTTYAWFVSMGDGYMYADVKTFSRYVWPVRSGQ